MANFDKFIDKAIDKGNDIVDRAEQKSNERQAMSENPEEEKQGITAKDMAAGGMSYAKDAAVDKVKEKAVDKFQDKFLNKDGDAVLSDSKKSDSKGNKSDSKGNKSDSKGMTDKYKNGKSDDFLDKSKNNKTAKNKGVDGEKNKNGTASKNPFGDSKKPNKESNDVFKKDPTAGANAAKGAAKDAVKEGAKDAAKEGAKDVAKDVAKEGANSLVKGTGSDVADIAKSAASGDIDKATDTAAKVAVEKGVEKATQAAVDAVAPGTGQIAGKIAGKIAGFATKLVQKTKAYKIGKKVGCIGCLGCCGILIGTILFIPILISFVVKTVGEIVDNIPIVGVFDDFIKEKLTDKLGLDFGDFDFEDIGLESAKMEEYAKVKERIINNNFGISKWVGEEAKSNTVYTYVPEEDQISDDVQVEYICDPAGIVMDYLPVFKIFAALETIDKEDLARELEKYFMNDAEFEFTLLEEKIVWYEIWQETKQETQPDGSTKTVTIDRKVRVEKYVPKFVPTKITSLTKIIEFEYEEITRTAGDKTYYEWKESNVKASPNYEVLALFAKYDWVTSEISTFEYIADTQHPLNEIYSVDMYGFTSTFTMPVDDYKIASEFGDTRAPYSAENPNKGIDILADEGTEVKAIADGKIEDITSDSITVDIGNDIKVVYSGVKVTGLSKGSEVKKGDVIAQVGDNNLHFEVFNKGKNINPQNFLASTLTGTAATKLEGASMDYYHQGQQPPAAGISIAEYGCGPTCLAMALSSPIVGGQHVTPVEVATRAKSLGLWGSPSSSHNGYGAYWGMFKAVAAKYGVTNIKQIDPKSNPDEIHRALEKRYPIIFSISGKSITGRHTKFTYGGHFILADGFYDDGYVRILDPNAKKTDGDHWANFYLDSNAKIIDDRTKDGLFTGARQAWIFYGK